MPGIKRLVPSQKQVLALHQGSYCCREAFWQIQPLKNGQPANYQDSDSADTAPQICLKGLNHASYHAVDPPALRNFYTRVLSFKSIERPDFPFDGAWLEGAGLLLHIIQDDPSVPKAINSWKVNRLAPAVHPAF